MNKIHDFNKFFKTSMILSNSQKIRFYYSLTKNFYDVICIGNKA